MSKRIEIDRDALRAIRLFAATHDIRYYLMGVLVEATADATRLIATNGHVLGIHHSARENSITEPTSLIVPNQAINLIRRRTKRQLPFIHLEQLDTGRWCFITHDTVDFAFHPIEGKFPSYAKLIPGGVSGKVAHFNPRYLHLAERVAREFRREGHATQVHHNGDSASMLSINGVPEFVGVLMPMREPRNFVRPTWLEASASEPQARAA